MTITIRQYTTQSAAQGYISKKLTPDVLQRLGPNVQPAVNQLDSNVFQVEISGDFNNEIDLTGL